MSPVRKYEPMTTDELLALPASVDVVTAGRAFGMGHATARELARNGEFPCRVMRVGNRWRVPRNELLRALGVDPADARADSRSAAVGLPAPRR
jgi:hypothetical protein